MVSAQLAMGLVLDGTRRLELLSRLCWNIGWRVPMTAMGSVLWFVGLPVSYFLLREFKENGAHIKAESQPSVENPLTGPAIPT